MANIIEYTDSGIVAITENETYAAVIEQYQTIGFRLFKA